MIIYLVVRMSYEGDEVVGVWDDQDLAIDHARKEAREWAEAFTGAVGHGIDVQAHTVNKPGTITDVTWKDYKVRFEGSRFVLDDTP